MSEDKSKLEEKALSEDELDTVAGGKTVILRECVCCGVSYDRMGPDGKPYCSKHYRERFGE